MAGGKKTLGARGKKHKAGKSRARGGVGKVKKGVLGYEAGASSDAHSDGHRTKLLEFQPQQRSKHLHLRMRVRVRVNVKVRVSVKVRVT